MTVLWRSPAAEIECRQHGRSPKEYPEEYARYGRTSSGTRRLRCKACARVFAPEPRPEGARRELWLHGEYHAMRMLTDHAPMRCNLARSGIGAGLLYQLLKRAHWAVRDFQCLGVDSRAGAAAGARPLPLRLAADWQTFGVNWSDRGDRRKVMVHGVATADAASGYAFAGLGAVD